uniref:Sperm surface protein Sp17 n=1 Tax=Oryctolagus cuniculus TaxID=9986 RepID=A0A5F9D872_RABIT
MSIPFSNTHYRIPQGFGNLLEGLTREILREQPDNIPAFAAAYFENLLEKREKTNFDPAEWGAKVDDRFYNNHAFQEHESEKCEAEEKSQSVTEEETPVLTIAPSVLRKDEKPTDITTTTPRPYLPLLAAFPTWNNPGLKDFVLQGIQKSISKW